MDFPKLKRGQPASQPAAALVSGSHFFSLFFSFIRSCTNYQNVILYHFNLFGHNKTAGLRRFLTFDVENYRNCQTVFFSKHMPILEILGYDAHIHKKDVRLKCGKSFQILPPSHVAIQPHSHMMGPLQIKSQNPKIPKSRNAKLPKSRNPDIPQSKKTQILKFQQPAISKSPKSQSPDGR